MGLGDFVKKVTEGALDLGQVVEEFGEGVDDLKEGNIGGALFNFAQSAGVALNTVGVDNPIVKGLQGTVAAEEMAELVEQLRALDETNRVAVLYQAAQVGNMSKDALENVLKTDIVPLQYRAPLEQMLRNNQ